MPTADELILQMQHLQAQAKNQLEARANRAGLDRIKSATQKLAWKSQVEVDECETIEREGEARLEQLREGGVSREEAPEYVAVKAKIDDAKKRLVKARAQLNFALDRMEEVERREYLAFHAEVRAETHGALADDLVK
jgi:ATP-dependent 26S proteasome regulatory subunit